MINILCSLSKDNPFQNGYCLDIHAMNAEAEYDMTRNSDWFETENNEEMQIHNLYSVNLLDVSGHYYLTNYAIMDFTIVDIDSLGDVEDVNFDELDASNKILKSKQLSEYLFPYSLNKLHHVELNYELQDIIKNKEFGKKVHLTIFN